MLTIAEHLEQKGREEGREKATRQLLRKLLMRDYGPLAEATEERLDTASLEQLDSWFDRAVSGRCQTLEDVLAD